MTIETRLLRAAPFSKPAHSPCPRLSDSTPWYRAEAQKEGKIGVALCGLGGFSRVSIAPELPFAKNVYLAGVITGHPDTKGREFAKLYGFPETSIYTYEQMPRLAENKEIVVRPRGHAQQHPSRQRHRCRPGRQARDQREAHGHPLRRLRSHD